MTTRTYTSVMAHTTDAEFRAWVAEFISNVDACGLVDTGDTGQINTTTVTRPAVNTAAGYITRKLPDNSLYFKIEFGTGTQAAFPGMYMTVGEGTNGTGTLTGQLSTRNTFQSNAAINTTNSYTTYICVTNDFFGVLFKASIVSATTRTKSGGYVFVGKTVDSSGTATSLGYFVLRCTASGSTSNSIQFVRRSSPAATYTSNQSFCVVPGLSTTSPTNSLDASGNIQAYTNWGNFPTVLPLLHVCTVRDSDVTELNTFSVTMVGATSHTYLNLGLQTALAEATQITSSGFTHSTAMIWE